MAGSVGRGGPGPRAAVHYFAEFVPENGAADAAVPATNCGGGALGLNLELVPAERQSDQAGNSAALQAAIDELPAEFRVVVAMFYFEECSYREISEKLDLPMGTVMSRLARAKGYLRSKLFET